ncbi:unnamed protein product, partial [Urochloa humidicola]
QRWQRRRASSVAVRVPGRGKWRRRSATRGIGFQCGGRRPARRSSAVGGAGQQLARRVRREASSADGVQRGAAASSPGGKRHPQPQVEAGR